MQLSLKINATFSLFYCNKNLAYWWVLQARKFKIFWKHWMDKRSATWPGVMNRNFRGYLIQIGPPTHNRIFARNKSDRTALVSLQDYCQLVKWYVIQVSGVTLSGQAFASLTSVIMTWCSPKKNLHAQLSGAPQKYFQSGPALAKTGHVHVCIFTI